jgi:diguanylate cyclase (GGDEF)-like protein
MTDRYLRFGLTPREHRISALPSTVGSILVLGITMLMGCVVWPQTPLKTILLLAFGAGGIAYLLVLDLLVLPSPHFRPVLGWVNAVLTAIGLLILMYAVGDKLTGYVAVLTILAVITSSVITESGPSYLILGLTAVGSLMIRPDIAGSAQGWTLLLSMIIMAIITLETIRQLKNMSRTHIRRLETISEFSRHVTSSLDKKQVIALLSAAFQNAVEADTYFVGFREDDELRLELIYDDGEYFEAQRVKLDGSLSSWVLSNQQSLFLPDLRKEVELPGVRLVLVGKHKTSLSWLGVPMRGTSVDGLISIGSYRPNAFDRADLELLTALAQHAAQALDNTYQHEQVELRSQLDSLTGALNHGNFLRLLQTQVDAVVLDGRPLALIMLDVDHFKLYNDTYGHLVGDVVLTALTATLRQHVKSTDAVGRWGGEEFCISLPNATAEQALQVALRIRKALERLMIRGTDQSMIPAPTVSQGIAVYPSEASNVVELIHLADRRLYMAKARGPNQIEPDAGSLPESSALEAET